MISRKEVEEILDAIEYFDGVLEEAGVYSSQIELHLNGYSGYIQFAGIVIWHSDEDERKTTGPNEDYEPLEPFIRRRIAEEVAILNDIAIALSKNSHELDGAQLIAQERKEQIEKHGYTLAGDLAHNNFSQLRQAAISLIATKGDHPTPDGWDENIWQKMLAKPLTERLIIAGALVAAEYDRVIASDPRR